MKFNYKILRIIVFLGSSFISTSLHSQDESDTLNSYMNGSNDSMAYVDAKSNDIYLYDESFKIIDTIFKKYAYDCESAQIEILNFNAEWSTVNVRMRSVCLYAGAKNDTILLKRMCRDEIKSVKIETKYLLTYIQHPKIYEKSDEKSKMIIDLVTTTPTDQTWPHIRDAQIIDIKPEWFKVKFKYNGRNYSGWIPGRYTCPMTFSWCG